MLRGEGGVLPEEACVKEAAVLWPGLREQRGRHLCKHRGERGAGREPIVEVALTARLCSKRAWGWRLMVPMGPVGRCLLLQLVARVEQWPQRGEVELLEDATVLLFLIVGR